MEHNWIEISGDAKKSFIDAVYNLFSGPYMDEEFTAVDYIPLSFYSGAGLFQIRQFDKMPSILYSFVSSKNGYEKPEEDIIFLDGTEENILEINDRYGFRLKEYNLPAYMRFYFENVSSENHVLNIVENIDEIYFYEELEDEKRELLEEKIKPIRINSIKDGKAFLDTEMLFNDTLFSAQLSIDEKGVIDLFGEETLITDLPVFNRKRG